MTWNSICRSRGSSFSSSLLAAISLASVMPWSVTAREVMRGSLWIVSAIM